MRVISGYIECEATGECRTMTTRENRAQEPIQVPKNVAVEGMDRYYPLVKKTQKGEVSNEQEAL